MIMRTGKEMLSDWKDVKNVQHAHDIFLEAKWVAVNGLLNDKELMVSLCDCDRHEDVHLKGCKYIEWKERLVK